MGGVPWDRPGLHNPRPWQACQRESDPICSGVERRACPLAHLRGSDILETREHKLSELGAHPVHQSFDKNNGNRKKYNFDSILLCVPTNPMPIAKLYHEANTDTRFKTVEQSFIHAGLLK